MGWSKAMRYLLRRECVNEVTERGIWFSFHRLPGDTCSLDGVIVARPTLGVMATSGIGIHPRILEFVVGLTPAVVPVVVVARRGVRMEHLSYAKCSVP